MRFTCRTTARSRWLVAALVLACASTIAGCGTSSGGSAAGSSTSTMDPASASSVPPAPSTIPAAAKAPCTALASMVTVDDLAPKNTGNWTAERQRIATDVASSVSLLAAAGEGVPARVAQALETLRTYATWVGSTVAAAPSYGSARSALDAYTGLAGVTSATTVVEDWRRTNC